MKTRCYTCYGSGAEVERDCRACEGTGRALHNTDFPCDKCKGTGDDDVACKDCKGTGVIVLDGIEAPPEPSDMDEDARNWVDEG
jgi:RecJ-like exonuclease